VVVLYWNNFFSVIFLYFFSFSLFCPAFTQSRKDWVISKSWGYMLFRHGSNAVIKFSHDSNEVAVLYEAEGLLQAVLGCQQNRQQFQCGW
jgi:hypothetical protein